jgi:hypothetical protein
MGVILADSITTDDYRIDLGAELMYKTPRSFPRYPSAMASGGGDFTI